jgi:hypothetical protein
MKKLIQILAMLCVALPAFVACSPAEPVPEVRSKQWKIEHRQIGDAGYGVTKVYYSKHPPYPNHGAMQFFEEGSGRRFLLSGDITVSQLP